MRRLLILLIPLILISCGGGIINGNHFSGSWTSITADGAPEVRSAPSAVWTGEEMIVWGGFTYYDNNIRKNKIYLNTGGIYNVRNDEWSEMSTINAPTARLNPFSIWTGTYMMIWGGSGGGPPLRDGALYDPVWDEWKPMSSMGNLYTACFTTYTPGIVQGDTVIFLSKVSDSITCDDCNALVTYNISLDTWDFNPYINFPINPSNGNQYLYKTDSGKFWYGFNYGGCIVNYLYDPTLNEWTPLAPWYGGSGFLLCHFASYENLIFTWTSYSASTLDINYGYQYDSLSNLWEEMPTNTVKSAISITYTPGFVRVGNKLITWGGLGYDSDSVMTYWNTGSIYNIEKERWSSTSLVNAPECRENHIAIEANGKLIIWGGENSINGTLNSGGIYTP